MEKKKLSKARTPRKLLLLHSKGVGVVESFIRERKVLLCADCAEKGGNLMSVPSATGTISIICLTVCMMSL